MCRISRLYRKMHNCYTYLLYYGVNIVDEFLTCCLVRCVRFSAMYISLLDVPPAVKENVFMKD